MIDWLIDWLPGTRTRHPRWRWLPWGQTFVRNQVLSDVWNYIESKANTIDDRWISSEKVKHKKRCATWEMQTFPRKKQERHSDVPTGYAAFQPVSIFQNSHPRSLSVVIYVWPNDLTMRALSTSCVASILRRIFWYFSTTFYSWVIRSGRTKNSTKFVWHLSRMRQVDLATTSDLL